MNADKKKLDALLDPHKQWREFDGASLAVLFSGGLMSADQFAELVTKMARCAAKDAQLPGFDRQQALDWLESARQRQLVEPVVHTVDAHGTRLAAPEWSLSERGRDHIMAAFAGQMPVHQARVMALMPVLLTWSLAGLAAAILAFPGALLAVASGLTSVSKEVVTGAALLLTFIWVGFVAWMILRRPEFRKLIDVFLRYRVALDLRDRPELPGLDEDLTAPS